MQIYKRIRFTKNELQKLTKEFDGYIWAAVDPNKCAISLGDDYVGDLRDVLIVRRCRLEDIYGVGIDLKTGEISFISQINRRNPTVDVTGKLTEKHRADVVRTINYFFEKLPAFGACDELDGEDAPFAC